MLKRRTAGTNILGCRKPVSLSKDDVTKLDACVFLLLFGNPNGRNNICEYTEKDGAASGTIYIFIVTISRTNRVGNIVNLCPAYFA